MRLLRKSLAAADDARRGAALLLAFLVLIVIIAIVYQINTVTLTDERITYNEITRSQMDLSIEAVLLQTYEDLKEDALAAHHHHRFLRDDVREPERTRLVGDAVG